MKIDEELKSYRENALKDFSESDNKILSDFEAMLKQLKNQNKQSFKFLQEVESLRSDLKGDSEKEEKNKEIILNKNAELENQTETLINCIMDIVDLVENFYSAAKKVLNEQDQDIIHKLYSEISKKLIETGFIPINKTMIKFESDKHYTIRTIRDLNKEAGVITEILRNGYIVNGKVIRRAEVIVNKL